MNHVNNDTKDWHNATTSLPETPLQTPPVAAAVENSPEPSCSNDTSTSEEQEQQQTRPYLSYPQEGTSSSSTMQQSQPYRQEQQQQESDVNRLPGMIAHSEPATSHPDHSGHVHQQPQQEGSEEEGSTYHTPAQSPSTRNNNNTVRGGGGGAGGGGRSAGLFANEIGPVFGQTELLENIYSSDRSTPLQVHVKAKMDRGFFMADNDWTCYRRNYFQISSVFSIHGGEYNNPYYDQQFYVQVGNQLAPITRFLLSVSARVSDCNKQVELIQHTPKRDKGPQFRPEPKPVAPGGNLCMSSVANNQNVVTFERLQYKTATANNGKRRAAQQYYICHVDLFAQTENHQLIKVATVHSSPLVVRGRSPGHYAEVSNNERRSSSTAAGSSQRQQRQRQEESSQERQHVFSSYPKPALVQQQEQVSVVKYEYSPASGAPYPYYHPAPAYPYPYASNAAPTTGSSNVSSPISHPPLPSPYAQHRYAVIHEGGGDPYAAPTSHVEEQHVKMMQHQQHYMQQAGPTMEHNGGYNDWQRARYNSSSSGGSSAAPSPGAQYIEGQQATYFTPPQHSSDTRSSTYSPTTPTYHSAPPPGNNGVGGQARKFMNHGVPNLMNNNKQQMS